MSETLKIGYLCPDEDALALPDTMVTAAAARELINSRGGVHGRPIELFAATDAGDPARAVRLARSWVDAGVLTVTGTSTAWNEGPMQVLEDAGVPFTGAAIDMAAYMSYVSRPLIGGAASELLLLAEVTAERAVNGRVGIVHADMEMAQGAVAMLMEQPLRQAGIADIQTAPATHGYAEAVKTLATHIPDVIVGLCEASDGADVVRSAREHAPSAQVVFTGACLDEARLFRPLGRLAEGLILTAAFWPYTDRSHPQVDEFHRAVSGVDGFVPSAFAQGGFAAIMTMADVFRRLGPGVPTPQEVLEHLDTSNDQPVYMQTYLSPAKASPLFPSLHNLDTLVLQRRGDELVDVGGGWRTPAALSP